MKHAPFNVTVWVHLSTIYDRYEYPILETILVNKESSHIFI